MPHLKAAAVAPEEMGFSPEETAFLILRGNSYTEL